VLVTVTSRTLPSGTHGSHVRAVCDVSCPYRALFGGLKLSLSVRFRERESEREGGGGAVSTHAPRNLSSANLFQMAGVYALVLVTSAAPPSLSLLIMQSPQ
jgi:hypothetical protein